ncbi:hypothetical protein EsH8_IX_000969 [Colletotrichum jinshuiense]
MSSSGGGGSSSSGGSSRGPSMGSGGGYTSGDKYAWGSKGKDATSIDNKGYKRSQSDNSYTYEYPPRKYNADGTVKTS